MITAPGAQAVDCHPDVLKVRSVREFTEALSESGPLIGANLVHLAGVDGSGVDIAVFDGGIDTDHPDLVSSLIGEACFTDVPPVVNACPDDPGHINWPQGAGHPAEDTKSGHGTAVSGVIASDGKVSARRIRA